MDGNALAWYAHIDEAMSDEQQADTIFSTSQIFVISPSQMSDLPYNFNCWESVLRPSSHQFKRAAMSSSKTILTIQKMGRAT
jgi:hypothetical protein